MSTTIPFAVETCPRCQQPHRAGKQCPRCGPDLPRQDAPETAGPRLTAPATKDAGREEAPRAGAANGTHEAALQTACEQWLRFHGIEYLHLSYRAREKRGWCDLTFAVHGIPYGIELKTATGKVTQDQADCHARLRLNGWTVAVCRSLDEFRNVVKLEE